MLNCLRRLPYCWNFTLLNVTVSPKLRASHCRLPPPIGASLVFCHVPLYWNAPGASPLLTEADAVSLVLTLISAIFTHSISDEVAALPGLSYILISNTAGCVCAPFASPAVSSNKMRKYRPVASGNTTV